MARRVRGHGWAATPLGPVEGWPQSLKTAVDLCLSSAFAGYVWWGPDLLQVYNDAALAILRAKHPAAFAVPAREAWSDVWGTVGPVAERVLATGEPVLGEDMPLVLDRGGPRELANFTFSYGALRDGSGAVAGVFVTAIETTARVRAEAALRESEGLFRALVTAGANMIYRMSPDWRRMHRLDGRDVLADTTEPVESWADLYLLPEDRPQIFAAVEAAKRGKKLFELEHRVRRADGGIGWVVSRAVPILGPGGEVTEWFGAGSDVTARRQAEAELRASEERQVFLLKLADALRPLADPVGVQEVAARVLGEHLGASRVNYAEIDGDEAVIEREHAAGVPSLVGRHHRLSDHGDDVRERFGRGRPDVVDDTLADPRLTPRQRAAYAAMESRAHVAVQLVKGGRPVAAMVVQDRRPRRWTPEEVALVEETAERTWAAVERARAEAELRASEERYRALFDSMDEAYAVVEVLRDAAGRWGDFLFLEVNPAFVRHTGMPHPVGRTATGLLSAPNPRWAEIYGRVAETGEAARFEETEPTLGRVFDLNVFRLGGPGSRRVAVLFADVTGRKRAEEALRASEERFRALLTATSYALYRMSPDWAEMIELQGGGFLRDTAGPSGGWLGAYIHPDDQPAVTAAIGRATREKGLFELEHRVRRADGSLGWTLSRAVPILDEGGGVKEWFGAASDVTARHEAEAALRESEGLFRSFAETSADVLWVVDAATGRLEYLSPAFEAIWGEPRGPIMADLGRWAEIVHPEDRARALEGLPRLLQGEAASFVAEYRIVRPSDGAVRWIRDTGFPIREPSGGAVSRVGGIAQDVTESREAADRARASEGRLRALVEGIPQLVWRAAEAGRWTWSSPQWHAASGLSDEQSQGLGWLAAIHPDDREGAMAAWGRAAAIGVFEADYRVRRLPAGRYRWFQARATPVRDAQGRIVEWLGTSTDVDDLRALQERQRLLLAELQHRVRNTLGVVRSIARRTAATSATVDDHATHLDGRLAAFARTQAMVTRDPAGGVDLGGLVAEELLAHAARDGEQVRVEGPPLRLRPKAAEDFGLAVHELATNAVKHGALTDPRGRVEVAWRVEADGAAAPLLRFSWTETGAPAAPPPAARRRGFGTELLERTLAYELKARTQLAFAPEGLRCTIEVPLTPRIVVGTGDP